MTVERKAVKRMPTMPATVEEKPGKPGKAGKPGKHEGHEVHEKHETKEIVVRDEQKSLCVCVGWPTIAMLAFGQNVTLGNGVTLIPDSMLRNTASGMLRSFADKMEKAV